MATKYQVLDYHEHSIMIISTCYLSANFSFGGKKLQWNFRLLVVCYQTCFGKIWCKIKLYTNHMHRIIIIFTCYLDVVFFGEGEAPVWFCNGTFGILSIMLRDMCWKKIHFILTILVASQFQTHSIIIILACYLVVILFFWEKKLQFDKGTFSILSNMLGNMLEKSALY